VVFGRTVDHSLHAALQHEIEVLNDFRNPACVCAPLDPDQNLAFIDRVPREIPDKGLRNRWPDGSAEIL
jgi:hypothetical protein